MKECDICKGTIHDHKVYGRLLLIKFIKDTGLFLPIMSEAFGTYCRECLSHTKLRISIHNLKCSYCGASISGNVTKWKVVLAHKMDTKVVTYCLGIESKRSYCGNCVKESRIHRAISHATYDVIKRALWDRIPDIGTPVDPINLSHIRFPTPGQASRKFGLRHKRFSGWPSLMQKGIFN